MAQNHKYGWGWRTKDGVTQTHATKTIEYFSSDIEEFIQEVRTAAALFEEPKISMETDYGTYGDRDRDVLTVSGWRNATDEEIAAAEQTLQYTQELQRIHVQNAVELLRKNAPDLLSEDA